MSAIRHLLAQRQLAVLICAVALLMKLVVPGGYMISADRRGPVITLCPQAGLLPVMRGHHGGAHDGHDKSGESAKPELPCAFSGLSAATLGAIDPIQLTALIAFVMALAFAGNVMPPPRGPTQLRPPPRGPPAIL